MNKLAPLVMLLLFVTTVHSADDLNIIGQQSFVSIVPLYQSWSDDNNFTVSEASIPLYAYYPLNRNVSVSMQANQASVTGDHLDKLSGFTDTQLSLNYYIESMNTILNTGLNLPSGKKALSAGEFTTSSFLSYDYYNFRVPNFGQGLNVTGGVTWAYPVSEKLAVGFGATYQLKGEFTPLENMVDKYKPGNEILVTAGIDFQLSETSTLSTDLVYINYAADTFGGQEVFDSGDLIYGNIQFKKYIAYNTFSILGRYRSKGKNRLSVAGVLEDENNKTTPNYFEMIANYRLRLNKSIYNNFIAEMRFFQEIAAIAAINIFSIGVQPEFKVSPTITIPVRFKYAIGISENDSRISGYEIGAGLNFNF